MLKNFTIYKKYVIIYIRKNIIRKEVILIITVYELNSTITNTLEKILTKTNVIRYFNLEDLKKSQAEVFIIPTKFASDFFKDKQVIYYNTDVNETIKCLSKYPHHHFINLPLNKDNVLSVFETLNIRIKYSAVNAYVPNSGILKVKLKDLNYINIVKRSLRFNLVDGEYIDSKCLRSSFAKETKEYLEYKELCFIAPSLLINLSNIKVLYKDYLEFGSGDILYFPASAYEKIKENYNNYWK